MDFRSLATPDDRLAAQYVRISTHFNPALYLSGVDDPFALEDPALHYVMIGERAGARGVSGFSAKTYEKLNPDLVGSSVNRLFHYEAHGLVEGRAATFHSDAIVLDDAKLDPGKPTVILLLHEATYSGAPILGWNLLCELKLTRNVVVVLRRGGALQPALDASASALVGPTPVHVSDNRLELENLAYRLTRCYSPQYVIANSVETRLFGLALKAQSVPLIALVHEFATHAEPYALSDFYKACDALVFPAELVRQSSLQSYPLISQRRIFILPQGPSEIPRVQMSGSPVEPGKRQDDNNEKNVQLASALREPDPPFTVVGLGSVDLRKGVDLFIAAATALRARHPDLAFRFIWLGERVHPLPHAYYTLLDEQISRSGLGERLIMADAVDDLAPVYAIADAFFLSSRLDPLPNVGIDATLRGIPLLCFKDATGFASLLEEAPATAWLVAPYLDSGAIAEKIAILAFDQARWQLAADCVRGLAKRRFNMMRYAARLDELGRAAAERQAHKYSRADLLMEKTAFDPQLYFDEKAVPPPPSREAAVRQYLDDSANVDFAGDAAWGHHPRRALAGFHSLLYGSLAPGFKSEDGVDPLVHFIANGRPAGPWRHEVIRLDETSQPTSPRIPRVRAAVHGHFHYTDNITDFLDALSINHHSLDLILTTTSNEAAQHLLDVTATYNRGNVSVEVMPNVGRDIGPLIVLLQERLNDYDIVGHIHGKRSVHTFHYDPDLGNRWRQFLWQHLIGPAAPVADIVIDRFARDPTLGMVFPENDCLIGWEKNREVAETLAPRLGLNVLPQHIEFPVGTMFWARPSALQRLADAKFVKADYPEEPLPIDGTMLHALERMMPLLAEAAGFRYATTYFPSFTR